MMYLLQDNVLAFSFWWWWGGGSDGHDDDGDDDNVIVIISHSAVMVYSCVCIVLLLLWYWYVCAVCSLLLSTVSMATSKARLYSFEQNFPSQSDIVGHGHQDSTSLILK
jgi:hypothetical protein